MIVSEMDDHLKLLAKQMEQRRIFNPLEARVTVNALPLIKESAKKALAARKADLNKRLADQMPERRNIGTTTEVYGTHYEMAFAPPGNELFNMKPPSSDFAVQNVPRMVEKDILVTDV